MARTYEVRVVECTAMSMGSGRLLDCWKGEVYHVETDETAWSSKLYGEKNSARLQAARWRGNYEHHLAKHGTRWEVTEREKKADLKARREAASRARNETTRSAEQLLMALRSVVAANPGTKRFDEAMAKAKALIAPLDWPEVPKA